MTHLSSWLKENKDYLIGVRRHLHENPEVGYEEKNTASHLETLLQSWGYQINRTEQMGYGFTVEIPNGNGPILALRCDMDALPIQDLKKSSYSSKIHKRMHACGHDVHMTILMGLAKYLKEQHKALSGSIRLLFQPAEECSPGGSIGMIKGGAIDNVDHIIGYHVFPKLNAGSVAFKVGHMSANVGVMKIELKGSGGHTSRPEDSADLILIASKLVTDLNHTIQKLSTDKKDNIFSSIKVLIKDTKEPENFAVKVARKGEHKYSSTELAKEVAGAAFEEWPNVKVNLDKPSLEINIQIINNRSIIYLRN